MTAKLSKLTYIFVLFEFDIEGLEAFALAANEALQGKTVLLAFADDGVIWGRFEEDSLHTSGEFFPDVSPPLRKETLQQMHIFNVKGEIRLWRTQEGFRAVYIHDTESEHEQALDESYLLWGTRYHKTKSGFSLVSEGERGFFHAPPLLLMPGVFTPQSHPLRLCIRHYLDFDETGSAYITLSRLVALEGGQA